MTEEEFDVQTTGREREREIKREREGQLAIIINGNIDCTHQFDEWQHKIQNQTKQIVHICV